MRKAFGFYTQSVDFLPRSFYTIAMNRLPNDPYLLLSAVNLKLRDYYDSLAELCEDLEEDEDELLKKLDAVGYAYDRTQNQFK